MRGHVRKRGKKWYVVLFLGFDENGKRKYKWISGFDKEKDAHKALTAKLHELDTGTYIDPTKQTFASYLEEWLKFKETQVRKNTFVTYESWTRKRIIPSLGKIELLQIQPRHLQQFYNELSDGEHALSRRSILHIHRILHDALHRAVMWNMIPKNPAESVDPPKAKRSEMKIWSREEVIKFLSYAKENRYYILFFLAITTGMRLGEILGLKWDDINFESETITVSRSVTRLDAQMVISPPKTERGHRIISLPDETITELKRHKSIQNQERLRIGSKYHDDGYIVTREDGLSPHPTSVRRQYSNIVEAARLPYIRIHDLRHTHASLLFEQGVHPKIVSERLGHATTGITLDTYTHVLPSLQEKTAKEFGQALFGNKKTSEKR